MTAHIILGGGVAGLAASYAARQATGQGLPIYEAGARPGGLLDSFEARPGWRFDHGVHLSFASEPEVRAVFDQTPYLTHEARSLNWDRGHWLRHPVQNNMHPLPAQDKAELIMGLVNRPELTIGNYRDWLVYQYGEPMAERWPLTYTRKYWTLDASEMGTDWIGSRMRRSDLREVLLGAMTDDTPNSYYISQMRYPERGGYRAFIEPLMAAADVRCGHRAVGVDWRRREVRFDNGGTAGYDRMISTMPLPELVRLMPDVPADVAQAADSLYATRMDLISIGLSREAVSPSLWFYIYDEDILAARVYSPSWKSPHNAPPGCSSLQFEVYSSRHKPLTLSVEALTENCLQALERMGLAGRDEVVFTHHKHVPYANVVFDLGMEARRNRVREWVQSKGIVLAGRFGEWDYLWSNQAFMSGMRAAQALLASSGEQ